MRISPQVDPVEHDRQGGASKKKNKWKLNSKLTNIFQKVLTAVPSKGESQQCHDEFIVDDQLADGDVHQVRLRYHLDCRGPVSSWLRHGKGWPRKI